jgi:two-component system sensor histidine kinase CpxA
MAEQLERHQGAQKRLLGDISHELRSPMTRLQMALGLAQQEATTEQAREKYLQRCQIEIERLEKMVADVLSLSRLENTLHGLEKEKIDVNILLNNIISDEQFTADTKAITITLNSTHDAIINADRALITSAISNVLSNAVKYSPEQSEIIVKMTKNQQTLTLTIIDSGHGVPEEALPKLYSPFYRVNLARDRTTGGTGLGLAIAKQAIIAHQGTITAKNIIDNQHNENSHSVAGLSVIIELPCL